MPAKSKTAAKNKYGQDGCARHSQGGNALERLDAERGASQVDRIKHKFDSRLQRETSRSYRVSSAPATGGGTGDLGRTLENDGRPRESTHLFQPIHSAPYIFMGKKRNHHHLGVL